MNRNFFNIAGEKLKILRFFIFLLFFTSIGKAQSINNLDIFYLLIDSAATQAAKNISSVIPEVSVTFELGIYYTIFENRIISRLSSNGLKIFRGRDAEAKIHNLNFVIQDAEVKYGEQERDGFLGEFYVSRELILSGNYLITSSEVPSSSELKEFNYSFTDKVKVEDIDKIENRSFPFTSGKLPSEPFFSSLLEPVIAVGAAAIAVILFFSVRSK